PLSRHVTETPQPPDRFPPGQADAWGTIGHHAPVRNGSWRALTSLCVVWSLNARRLASGARLAVPDWLTDVVPEWLAEVMRPKKVPVPWGTMALAVLALWVP